MYGVRDAAQYREYEYVKFTEYLGLAMGRSAPGMFPNAERDIYAVTHGDDRKQERFGVVQGGNMQCVRHGMQGHIGT